MSMRIYARSCTLASLSQEDAASFVAAHHRQGMVKKASNLRSYGLYHEGELVGAALFCNPRTHGMQRRYTNELLRLVFKTDVRVVGGASRLIGHFLSTEPWDLFTYQDSSGEATKVYEHSGLTLRSEAVPKEVLVRDGLTHESAKNNWRDWISLEQAVRLGPDALLGTSLGEVFHEDGKRKTNVELFVEECGYHLETIPGDRIYEWRNPNVGFYVYKIESSVDSGYYLGRHHLRGELTEERCLTDGYMGSGGKKFQQWVNEVGAETLRKTVLSLHSTWEEVVQAEKSAIGNLPSTDPHCKNFLGGGTGLGRSVALLLTRECEVHGLTVHNGSNCMRCSAKKSWSMATCGLHGRVPHRGGKCEACKQGKLYSTRECGVHGLTTFRAGSCVRCTVGHTLSLKHCPEHGLVLHQGNSCATCSSQRAVTQRECPIHGMTKHQGDKCSTCTAQTTVSLELCPVHGETKHQGDHCMRCNAQAQLAMGECPIHGPATLKGGTCTRCTAVNALSEKVCEVHGLTTHQGRTCTKCSTQKTVTLKECPRHGLTKHQGSTCNRCNAESSVAVEHCEKHGDTKFQGGRCVACRNDALITLKTCPIHGERKHRGDSCYGCVSDRKRAKQRS